MRTAGTESRRSGNETGIGDVHAVLLFLEDAGRYDIGVQLIDLGDDILAVAGNPGLAYLFFHEGIQFFDDVEFVDPIGKGSDFLHRQGIGETQLQVRCLVAQDFFGIHIGCPGSDDADFRIMHLYFVEGTDFGITLQFFFPFFDDIAAFLGNGRYGIHFFPLFLIEDGRHFLAVQFFDETLGMADAGLMRIMTGTP